jgi:CheY-like chemotaxis protein
MRATPPVDVLIAEDDPEMRRGLRLLLERQGYTCAEAGNGRDALDLARRSPPRCVLLDLAMPELDGFAVARQLRADSRTRAAHIHCLTGCRDPGTREQAYRAGVEVFLTKPVDAGLILDVVSRQVRRPEAGEVSDLEKWQAEELLDRLQAAGATGLVVSLGERGLFTVRCTCPPGLRLIRDEEGAIRLVPAQGRFPGP